MNRSFPVILTELRKEKGVSQKEAAAALGVSQALLSHYEKGIRECSMSFYIRAADYYDVTCDYLFGRSSNKSGDYKAHQNGSQVEEDSKFTDMTLLRAALEIREHLRCNTNRLGMEYRTYLSLWLYRLLVKEASIGNVPKSWVCDEDWKHYGPFFLSIINAACEDMLLPGSEGSVDQAAPVPRCIRTVSEHAHAYLMKVIADNVPPIPDELRK